MLRFRFLSPSPNGRSVDLTIESRPVRYVDAGAASNIRDALELCRFGLLSLVALTAGPFVAQVHPRLPLVRTRGPAFPNLMRVDGSPGLDAATMVKMRPASPAG